eukprot:jgi/Picre1/27336/NNA_000305.t1
MAPKRKTAQGESTPGSAKKSKSATNCDPQGAHREAWYCDFHVSRANTPGCTKQACGFRDDYEKFKKCGFEVYGMSYDKPKSQKNWKIKYTLPYHLLTDESGAAIKAFGANKAPKGVIRSHIVIAKGGKVLDIRNKISPGDSFTSALETAEEHSK